MSNLSPEQKAREVIDKKLLASGWLVQDNKKINFNEGLGIAVREYQTDSGPADYVLFIDRKPVGVIEAKKDEEGHRLSVHEDQSEDYAHSKLKWFQNNEPLPFIYESTSTILRFRDIRDPKPRSREVFTFHRPETFKKWLKNKPLRARLLDIPELPEQNLRDCQIKAINNLEKSIKSNKPKALVQMATGSGKTFTAITAIYRLLKFANVGRVLFLVDTKNLGEQAEQEFLSYLPNDDNRKFSELYNVQRLKSSYIPDNCQVYISTIQRLYSILKGEELNEGAEEQNPAEFESWKPKEPLPVVYNSKVPLEFFDFIIVDECHRSIYNLWKQVLDYFDSFLIGLTATPDKRTFGFFNENVVSEYTHEEAVADGVNVGFDVYLIETEITKNGAVISKASEYVEKREKFSRRKRWEQIDEDISYYSNHLDKEVVNQSTIRNIIRTFKNKLPEIFPNRTEVPKTLIFAKTDSHADDIIQIVREEFDEGNAFCKKVTYKNEEDPKSILAQFRNEYNPRIAVTVDMIATGTDVRPLECLLFMRDVKSKNYFEQMKGRGTRTIKFDDLKKVTPSALSAKTHFVIVDAIGVTKSIKTDSRPLERKKGVSLKDLLYGVMMGASDEDTLSSLASRLTRLEKQLTDSEKEQFIEKANGKSIQQVVHDLLNVNDPDKNEELILKIQKETGGIAPIEAEEQAKNILISEVQKTFSNSAFNDYVENVRRVHEQIIDNENIDTINFSGWNQDSNEKAESMISDFKQFLIQHKEEITALKIFYDQPYRRRELTYKMIKEILEVLKAEKPSLAPLRVWQAYEQLEKVNEKSPANELIALVSLIRRVTGLDDVLTAYDKTVDKNFQRWVFQKQAGSLKFNEDQMAWLRMIKEHIITSFHLDGDDLDYSPFDSKGGIGKMYLLFGDEMNNIIDELNEELVA